VRSGGGTDSGRLHRPPSLVADSAVKTLSPGQNRGTRWRRTVLADTDIKTMLGALSKRAKDEGGRFAWPNYDLAD